MHIACSCHRFSGTSNTQILNASRCIPPFLQPASMSMTFSPKIQVSANAVGENDWNRSLMQQYNEDMESDKSGSLIQQYTRDLSLKRSTPSRISWMPMGYGTLAGGIVALGKFDALHIGHRALAEQAARMGKPFLLSFTGMADVLGWEKRLPIVAPCDRARVMSLWSSSCGGLVPVEVSLDFANVRHLSPRDFVEKLAKDLKVKAVIAGANYRFGYKAAGDASDLVQLSLEFGLKVSIVDPVMDKTSNSTLIHEGIGDCGKEKGQVSSTRVRRALAEGNLERVRDLLGRRHRVMMALEHAKEDGNTLVLPIRNVLNQTPVEGTYSCSLVLEEQEPAKVLITASHIAISRPGIHELVNDKSDIAIDL